MATWELDSTVLNVNKKEARITAIRTDGEDIRTFHILSAILKTSTQKTEALNNIWEQYQTSITKQIAMDSFIGDLKIAGKQALEIKEIT